MDGREPGETAEGWWKCAGESTLVFDLIKTIAAVWL